MTRPIGYITNPLVRHSAERDPEALANAVANPQAGMVILAGDLALLRAGVPGPGPLPGSVPSRLPGPH